MGISISPSAIFVRKQDGTIINPATEETLQEVKNSPLYLKFLDHYTWDLHTQRHKAIGLSYFMPYSILDRILEIQYVEGNVHLYFYSPNNVTVAHGASVLLSSGVLVDLAHMPNDASLTRFFLEDNTRVRFRYPYHSKQLLDVYFYPEGGGGNVTDNSTQTYYGTYIPDSPTETYTYPEGLHRLPNFDTSVLVYVDYVIFAYACFNSSEDYYYTRAEYMDADGVWHTIWTHRQEYFREGFLHLPRAEIHDYCREVRLGFWNPDYGMDVYAYFVNIWGTA